MWRGFYREVLQRLTVADRGAGGEGGSRNIQKQLRQVGQEGLE